MIGKIGFPWALAAGLLTSGGIGLGFVAIMTIWGIQNKGDVNSFVIGVSSLAFLVLFGSALLGAIVGHAVSRHSRNAAEGAGAGFLAGALGYFLILLLVTITFSVLASDEAKDSDATGLNWKEFGQSLFFLIPAGLGGAATGALVMPAAAATDRPPSVPTFGPSGYGSPPASAPAFGFSPSPSPPPPPPMGVPPASSSSSTTGPAALRTVMCPRCRNVLKTQATPGMIFGCPNCGFSAPL